jgi:hypothetical protein
MRPSLTRAAPGFRVACSFAARVIGLLGRTPPPSKPAHGFCLSYLKQCAGGSSGATTLLSKLT